MSPARRGKQRDDCADTGRVIGRIAQMHGEYYARITGSATFSKEGRQRAGGICPT
jgi:hypothetical protein